MVATDTVVGIVGAVLLVAVMAGVFAYEYNNPATAAGTTDQQSKERFASDPLYQGLSPTDDIDGDGKANYMDSDIDGDGKDNGNDTDVAVHFSMSGALGPQVGTQVAPDLKLGLVVGNGSVHVTSTVTTSTSAPGVAGNFLVELLAPDGHTVATKASTPGGPSTLTVETPADAEITPGSWTVRVSQNTVGPGGNLKIDADVHYGMMMDHSAH
jgi:hypothetical protein